MSKPVRLMSPFLMRLIVGKETSTPSALMAATIWLSFMPEPINC